MHWDDPIAREPSAAITAISLGRSPAGRTGFYDGDSSVRRGPIRWLVLCGIILIAAIALGTAIAVGSLRHAAALADWREQTRLLIGFTVLVIAVILSLIVRQLLRQNQLSRMRLDTALN